MGEMLMKKLKAIVRKHQERLIVAIQLILCTIFAGRVIDKEIKQKLGLSSKNAKKEAKRSEKLKNLAMRNAKKLARAEYKITLAKLRAKAKKNKAVSKLILKKYKDRLKKKNSKKRR